MDFEYIRLKQEKKKYVWINQLINSRLTKHLKEKEKNQFRFLFNEMTTDQRPLKSSMKEGKIL